MFPVLVPLEVYRELEKKYPQNLKKRRMDE